MSTTENKNIYYHEKRIVDMTREELIDALVVMKALYEDAIAAHSRTLDVWNHIRQTRAGK